jgi:hypothetical protein
MAADSGRAAADGAFPRPPFVTALRREKTYAADRGTVKETVTEAERIPLTRVTALEGDEYELAGDGHRLRLRLEKDRGRRDAVLLRGERLGL